MTITAVHKRRYSLFVLCSTIWSISGGGAYTVLGSRSVRGDVERCESGWHIQNFLLNFVQDFWNVMQNPAFWCVLDQKTYLSRVVHADLVTCLGKRSI